LGVWKGMTQPRQELEQGRCGAGSVPVHRP
jgi:hypothetical protein